MFCSLPDPPRPPPTPQVRTRNAGLAGRILSSKDRRKPSDAHLKALWGGHRMKRVERHGGHQLNAVPLRMSEVRAASKAKFSASHLSLFSASVRMFREADDRPAKPAANFHRFATPPPPPPPPHSRTIAPRSATLRVLTVTTMSGPPCVHSVPIAQQTPASPPVTRKRCRPRETPGHSRRATDMSRPQHRAVGRCLIRRHKLWCR